MIRFSESAVRLVRSSLIVAGLVAAAALSACSDAAEPSRAIAPTEPARTIGSTAPITFDVSSLEFGDQVVGTASAPKVITLTNNGTTDLVSYGIFTSGTDWQDFYVQYNSGGTCNNKVAVPPGGSCTLYLVFKPTALGPRSGFLQILLYDNTSAYLNYTGNGVLAPGVLSVSPSALSFGSLELGKTSAPKNVVVENTGTTPLTLYSAMTSGPGAGDFPPLTTSDDCVLNVAMQPGQKCTLSFVFAPTLAGARSTTLEIDSDGGKQSVAFDGTGVAPIVYADVGIGLGANPTSAMVGKPLTYTITVKNLGSSVASGVTVTDVIPSTTTFVKISTSTNAPCTAPAVGGTGTVICSLGSMAPGATTTIQLVVNVLSGGRASLGNTATVSTSPSVDPVSANNSATVTTTVYGKK